MSSLNKYNFTNDDDEWYFEEYFDKVTEFEDSYSNSKGYVSFWVDSYDYDNEAHLIKPHNYQESAFKYFVENTEKILNALCIGIIEYYPKVIQEYNLENIPELKDVKVKTIDDVKNTISIDVIHILGQSKDDIGYLGFSGRCPWDPEHGFGVVMHRDRVVKIEDADVASSNLYIILEDKMTKEEWKAFTDDMERQRAESLAKYEEEKKLNLGKEQQELKVEKTETNHIVEDILETQEKNDDKKIETEYNESQSMETENLKNTENKKWWQFWKK